MERDGQECERSRMIDGAREKTQGRSLSCCSGSHSASQSHRPNVSGQGSRRDWSARRPAEVVHEIRRGRAAQRNAVRYARDRDAPISHHCDGRRGPATVMKGVSHRRNAAPSPEQRLRFGEWAGTRTLLGTVTNVQRRSPHQPGRQSINSWITSSSP